MTTEEHTAHPPPTEEVEACSPCAPPEEDFKDKYLRLLAEMENSRKRMQKEKLDATRFGIENVLADILMPMDNLENALRFTEQMSPETKQWAMGFQMILGQFRDVLSEHGVVSFNSQGEHFDAHKHEAVESEETDKHPEGTIIQEFIKGYRCGDRTIRPARVKVAKTPTKENKGE